MKPKNSILGWISFGVSLQVKTASLKRWYIELGWAMPGLVVRPLLMPGV
jgi:hypothetical protein